jgi:transcriptional regulator with XRE-family HTH domain
MSTLAELLQSHFRNKGLSAREVAGRLGISYPSLLSWATKGGIPRKAEHRDALRRELVLQPDEFARALAESGRDTVDLPADGPLDLRQLVVKHLHERGLTERTFADLSGISYAILVGITKHGQVPRAGTIDQLAEKLGISAEDVRAAASRGRTAAGEAGVAGPPDSPGLARLAAERVAASGMSAAAFAHAHGIPYLALSALLSTGRPPERAEALESLKTALGLDEAAFAAGIERAASAPEPSNPRDAVQAAHPLHEAIVRLVREKGWTTSALSAAAGISQLTAARLLKQGELPARENTHAKIRQLLGLDEAAYADLLARSRPPEPEKPPRPEPVVEPEPEPLHPLHAALRSFMRERDLTQQAFAKAVDLGIQTAAGLLKGELPVRQSTHEKLRQLLALDETAYAALLPAQPDRPARVAKVAVVDDEAQRLASAICGLDAEQREAVWQLVKALKSR